MDQSARLVCLVIRGYQFFSSRLPRRCRFEPSCSEYMRQAIETLGVGQGSARGIVRLLKCHPWHPGGYDPLHLNP